MNKTTAIVLTLVTALVAVFLPVYFAIYLARDLSLDAESGRALLYARDILHRSEATTEQIGTGISKLLAVEDGARCDDSDLALMQEIDLSSSYIQAIGSIEGDYLVCSSLGLHEAPGIPLGPVNMTTSNNADIRFNVTFDFTPGSNFIVVESEGYAAILHKDLPIDTTTEEPDVVLATWMLDNNAVLTARGVLVPEWLEIDADTLETVFTDLGYVVSVTRSATYRIGSLAAVPQSYLNQRTRNFALLLVPIGLIAGAVMAFAVLHLARMQLALPAVIKTALRRHEFFMAYQPIIDLRSGKMAGVEALLRWRRPGGEMVRPDLFIPVAEDNGIISLITARVIELIKDEVGDIFRQFPDFHIGINLSAADLHSPHTASLLQDLASSTGAGPQNLIAEATERSFIDHALANTVVASLRAVNIGIAIDDFGTGYSSLASLQHLALDILKIDRAFVSVLGTAAPTSNVVSHIIDMAKDLHLEMIAEGVETEAQATYLRQHGVQYAQGWLFGKPMSWQELSVLLKQQAAA